MWLTLACGAALAAPRIVSPAQGATVHDNAGRVQVVVTDIEPGQRVQAVIDGQAASERVAAPEIQLSGLARGEHRLSVLVLDPAGRVVARTPERTFYVWRASRLFPSRQAD